MTSAIRQSQMGTTSACAENTLRSFPMDSQPGNYLRVRGEYVLVALTGGLVTELPPRARRILILLSLCDVVVGTTSACAENTRDQAVHQNDSWNYLRVRGEYVNGSRVWVTRSELPPRARRIHGDYLVEKPEYGTTSACAENTVNLCGLRRITRNYLRVRGEYSPPAARVRSSKELPPRARRIRDYAGYLGV
mgnify:CR=1 FL=1